MRAIPLPTYILYMYADMDAQRHAAGAAGRLGIMHGKYPPCPAPPSPRPPRHTHADAPEVVLQQAPQRIAVLRHVTVVDLQDIIHAQGGGRPLGASALPGSRLELALAQSGAPSGTRRACPGLLRAPVKPHQRPSKCVAASHVVVRANLTTAKLSSKVKLAGTVLR